MKLNKKTAMVGFLIASTGIGAIGQALGYGISENDPVQSVEEAALCITAALSNKSQKGVHMNLSRGHDGLIDIQLTTSTDEGQRIAVFLTNNSAHDNNNDPNKLNYATIHTDGSFMLDGIKASAYYKGSYGTKDGNFHQRSVDHFSSDTFNESIGGSAITNAENLIEELGKNIETLIKGCAISENPTTTHANHRSLTQ